ncbi:16S rRNA (guanine(527)-N(7))-methyltransferase RsmG [Flavihumibacter petaseus]|uniref:Ribosomal RNA small subunit methyltransferase G n=1 Tax=Flavihumibacter petaseus NBRC 106054 TaxID=1220578 RepID=A0A0E9MVX2_9BACT|nr:16S rRNA (guanine(527)-N(7))-methyltransferase RsmG [Flavihumibacter petaseus]GAO41280.1 16S rRNA methyltransferase RsmG [Flavihumibacter petaseus NBRC 106054]
MEKAPSKLGLIETYFSEFTPKQLEQLAALEGLYDEWNSKINVISRKDISQLYQNHVLHSLAIAAAYPFPKGVQVLDIGTGGGFPGIPLAIFYPEVKFFLADSINKKLTVVKEIAGAIGLQNIETRHTRVEEIRDRKFDYVVSRAVAPLGDLWKWARPLLLKRPSEGEFPASGLICLKGGDLAAEIAASGTRPRLQEVFDFFPEPYFREKYILYVHR